MIKNLFDFENEPKIADDPPSSDGVKDRLTVTPSHEPVAAFEVPVESKFFIDREPDPTEFEDEPTSEMIGMTAPAAMYEPVRTVASSFDDENLLELAPDSERRVSAGIAEAETASSETALVLSSSAAEKETSTGDSTESDFIFSHAAPKPVEPFDAARARGLAFSAGIAVIGSVTFLMLLGWFADLLMGTKPWGVVGGIIVGGILGFVQLFRIAGQIFRR